MDDEKSSFSSTLVSALAFLAIGLALAGASYWVFVVVAETHRSAAEYGVRISGRAGRATIGLPLLGIALAMGALFFAAVAVWTLKLGLTDFRKKTGDADDSWRDMPYPKG